MSLAVLYSRALAGLDAPLVTVEVHLANGLPGFTIVGLPDTEVKEARDRVRAAILICRFEVPARRITVNLAPADLPKESGRFDLPIARSVSSPLRGRFRPARSGSTSSRASSRSPAKSGRSAARSR
jgi:magnesium chelatase family protein